MDERGRKEEPSLPPDYVSLAQLQERWLQKQEERKLKQKQEEEEMRERDAGAQKDKDQNQNQNQKGSGKMAGGFVGNTGVILDRGKGKEMVTSGPGNEGESDKRREVIRRGKPRYFKKAAAVEEKASDSGGGDWSEGAGNVAGDAVRAGIRSRGGGVGDGVEEICNVSVGEVLSCNGVREEIGGVKRTDLRGGSRGNGRNWGSRRVNELQSGTGLDLEKEVENERGHDQNWRGRERGKNGGHRERIKGNEVDFTLEKKTEDKISDVSSEISSLSVVDRNRNRGRSSKGSNKVKEDIVEGEGSNVDKMALMNEKVDHEVLAGESALIGKHKGVVKGYQINENRRKNLGQERRHTKPEIATEKNRIEVEGLNGNKMALEIEKKVDHGVLAGESATIDENRVLVKANPKKKKWRGKDRKLSRPELSAKEDEIDREGSNGNKVALEIEKKMDHEVPARENAKPGENRWIVKSYQKNEEQMKDFGKERRFTRPVMSAKVDRIEGEGSNDYKVRLENEKKVGREILDRENAKVGDNRGFFKGYQRNEQWRGGFRRGMRLTRYEISDSRWKTNSRENGMVWVKKEEKLGA